MQTEIDNMLKTGGGTIVNLASIASLIGFPVFRPMWPLNMAPSALRKMLPLNTQNRVSG